MVNIVYLPHDKYMTDITNQINNNKKNVAVFVPINHYIYMILCKMSSNQRIIYYTARTSIYVILCRTPYYGWVKDKFGSSI